MQININVACLLYHLVDELEFMSVYSTLRRGELPKGLKLNIYTLAKSRNAVETLNDVIISPHWGFMSAPEPDVIIIVGGDYSFAKQDKVIINYLRAKLGKLKYIIGMAEGMLLLREIGVFPDSEPDSAYEILSGLRQNEKGEWFAGKNMGLDVARELLKVFVADFSYPI